MRYQETFDNSSCTVQINGKFGISELAEMLDFLKTKKAESTKTDFKVGDEVYRDGYREYGTGEVTEVWVTVYDDGETVSHCIVDNLGQGFESEFRKVERN